MNSKKIVKFFSLMHQHQLIKDDLEMAFKDTIQGSSFIRGPALDNFEKHYANYIGTNFCVGVGNGLDALIISLKALGIGDNDEVIVPANTYHASWLAVASVGAKIIPVEPDERTFNLDGTKIGKALTKRTKAILPVHLYGQPCNMTIISEVAKETGCWVVEDNAQAQGAKWLGKQTGSWGSVNATSFYPTKNLGALGDGGAVTTDNAQLSEFARVYRNYGSSSRDSVERLGVNSRLDEIQAAFLTVKLQHLDDWNRQRRTIAEKYNERLKNVQEIKVPFVEPNAFHVYHLYVVKAARRDQLYSYLAERGIETMIHYQVPPHLQKAYQYLGLRKGDLPITEALAESMLSLPLWIGMTDEDIDYVADTIKRFYH